MAEKTLINSLDLEGVLNRVNVQVNERESFDSYAEAIDSLKEQVQAVYGATNRDDARLEAIVLATQAVRFVLDITDNDEIDDEDFEDSDDAEGSSTDEEVGD